MTTAMVMVAAPKNGTGWAADILFAATTICFFGLFSVICQKFVRKGLARMGIEEIAHCAIAHLAITIFIL